MGITAIFTVTLELRFAILQAKGYSPIIVGFFGRSAPTLHGPQLNLWYLVDAKLGFMCWLLVVQLSFFKKTFRPKLLP